MKKLHFNMTAFCVTAAFFFFSILLAGCRAESAGNSAPEAQTDFQIQGQAPTSAQQDQKPAGASLKIHVSTVDELVRSIDSDVCIVLAPGTYDLSEWTEEIFDGTLPDHVEMDWDFSLKLTGLHNLSMIAEEPEKDTMFVVTNEAIPVLSFADCESLLLRGLSFGHTVPSGFCNASALKLDECTDIQLESVDLYGCGTYGLEVYGGDTLRMEDSTIHDCAYGALLLMFCPHAEFHDSSFLRCGEYTILDSSGSELLFVNCTFQENKGPLIPQPGEYDYDSHFYFEGVSLGYDEAVQLDNTLPWCGNGTLEGFRNWASQAFPDAMAGLARVGEVWDYTGGLPFWESVDSAGYPPFLTVFTPSDPQRNGWIETEEKDYPEKGTIWCLLPLNRDVNAVLHKYCYSAGGKRQFLGDIEIHPEGEPVLFFWNSVCWPEPTLSVTLQEEERKVTFDLETNSRIPPRPEVPMGALLLPEDGSVFDFTVYPDSSPLAPWRLSGRWQSWDMGEEKGDRRHELWLHRDGRLTWIIRERDGNPVSVCAGTWSMDENGGICMSYANFPQPGGTGTSLTLEPYLDGDGAMTLYSGEGRPDFCDGTGRPLVFREHSFFSPPEENSRLDEAKQLALDCYESLHGLRPAHAETLFVTQEGPLVCLWDDGDGKGAGIALPRAWYVSEPDRAAVKDYLTGELLTD